MCNKGKSDTKTIKEIQDINVGDKVLKIVADILQNSIRKEDTLARLAGDEFTIIMEDLKYSQDAFRSPKTTILPLST